GHQGSPVLVPASEERRNLPFLSGYGAQGEDRGLCLQQQGAGVSQAEDHHAGCSYFRSGSAIPGDLPEESAVQQAGDPKGCGETYTGESCNRGGSQAQQKGTGYPR